jgi:glycosyltransferase involved in cell wall biosynthesis
MSTRILVLSRAIVGPSMASPGIRAYQIAGALGRALPEKEITLAIPMAKEVVPPKPNVKVQVWHGPSDAVALAREHEVTVARNFPPHFARLLGQHRFALDAFTPFYIEWMEFSRRDIEPMWRRTWMAGNRWYLNTQLTLADFIFAPTNGSGTCGSACHGAGAGPPDVYERDPSLRRFIDVVPYGVPQTPLDAHGPVMKGVVPGIEPTDRVVLWNGSVTEWNDTITLVHAMDRLAGRRPEVKLVFMGIDHPDYVTGPSAGTLARTIQLGKDLALDNRNVFFLRGWVPYERIDDWLGEADLSVCLGYENLESRFAFRTRYVDCFRAQLPLLCTQGDVLAERVRDGPLGITVPERDADAVAAGIERLLDDGELNAQCRANMAAIGKSSPGTRRWSRSCGSARRANLRDPADRRRMQAYVRGGGYFALKKLCRSGPLH